MPKGDARQARGYRVDIHEYDSQVGTGSVAVNDAAFAWLRAQHPEAQWELRHDHTYDISTPVDMRGIPGQALHGGSRYSSVIRQVTPGQPVVRMGARNQRLERVKLRGPGDGIGLYCELPMQLCVIDHVMIEQVATGIGMDATNGIGFFSNSVRDLRVSAWTDWAVDTQALNIGGGSGGTGNDWSNIYLNNFNGTGPGACIGGLKNYAMTESNFDQVNIEAMAPSQYGIWNQLSPSMIFDSLHYEQIEVANLRALMLVFSNTTTVNVRGLSLYNIITAAGTDCAVLTVGNNTHTRIESGSYIPLGGVIAGNWDLVRASGTLDTAEVHAVDLDDPLVATFTNPGTGAGAYVAAGVPGRVLREFNDDWRSLTDGTDVYRVTAPGGTITTTLV